MRIAEQEQCCLRRFSVKSAFSNDGFDLLRCTIELSCVCVGLSYEAMQFSAESWTLIVGF